MAKKKTIPAASFRPKPKAPQSRTVSAGKTPPGPAGKQTPPGPAGTKSRTVSVGKTDPHAEKLAWEVIANSLAKSSNGEVLRWRYNEANGELIVLLVDGRKFHSYFNEG